MAGRLLAGVRVLDLTRVVAGPFATAILADLGAEVIKLERPQKGDDYRYGPSPVGETSLSFQNTNRGKRSITLDLRAAEGRALFLRLVDGADAVVENFRAGWMDARGLGPEVIRARNPRCVVASLSGFGRTGPRAGQASYDIVAQATGGLMAMTGFPDGPPVRGGGALGDFVGGLYLALGIVTALFERTRTGEARALDLSNQDALFAVTDSAMTIHRGIGAPASDRRDDHLRHAVRVLCAGREYRVERRGVGTGRDAQYERKNEDRSSGHFAGLRNRQNGDATASRLPS